MLGTCPVGSKGPTWVSPCHRVMAVLVITMRDTQCLASSPFPETHSSASVAQSSLLLHPVEPCPGTLEQNDWQGSQTQVTLPSVGILLANLFASRFLIECSISPFHQ